MPNSEMPNKSLCSNTAWITIRAIDLSYGVGGLTRGLEEAGIDVALGIDIDPACEHPYTANNEASFLLKSVEDVTASDIGNVLNDAPFTLLAGCAPCQPFLDLQPRKASPIRRPMDSIGAFLPPCSGNPAPSRDDGRTFLAWGVRACSRTS